MIDPTKHPLTINGIITSLPLVLALIGGTTAYNNLQLQITELRTISVRDSVYLKETLDGIRSDIRDLKAEKDKQNGTK